MNSQDATATSETRKMKPTLEMYGRGTEFYGEGPVPMEEDREGVLIVPPPATMEFLRESRARMSEDAFCPSGGVGAQPQPRASCGLSCLHS